MKYLPFLGSTTETIILIATISLVFFTAKGITDPKDFITFLSMVASYKFGRAISSTSTPNSTQTTTTTNVNQATNPLDQLPG